MSWIAVGGSVVGAGISYLGAKESNDASAEAAEVSRDLPDWLAPYYIGNAEPSQTILNRQTVPINYNWLDTMNSVATSGMPGNIAPMHMNNPMMTFENVYTPVGGGPWGVGMGPGQLTTEAGIPTGPGNQFVDQPEGFVPGNTNAGQAADPAGSGGGYDQAILDAAQRYQNASRYAQNSGGGEGFSPGPVSSLQALQWAQNNPNATEMDIYQQGILAPYISRGR